MDSDNWETESVGAHAGGGKGLGLSHTLDLVGHVAGSTATGTHKKYTGGSPLDGEDRDDAYVHQKINGPLGSVEEHLKHKPIDMYEPGGIKNGGR